MADLEELYREIILDHYRSPEEPGELDSPPAHRVEGFNPLCGDEVVLSMVVEDGTLADIKIAGTGCSISQSSASLMSAAVKGRPVGEVRQLIRTFKGMMSIHEASLEHDGDGGGRRARGDRPRQAGRAGGAPGRREVPGAHQVRHPQLEHARPGPRRGGRRGLLDRAGASARQPATCPAPPTDCLRVHDRGERSTAVTSAPAGRQSVATCAPELQPCVGQRAAADEDPDGPEAGLVVKWGLQVVGLNDGGAGAAGAVLVPVAGVPGAAAAGGAVVGVTGGGGLGLPAASGGGLVGVTRLEPKMLTSICWAAGWSTVRTSPRPPKPLARRWAASPAQVGGVERVIGQGEPDQLVEAEAVVDLDALVDATR